MTPDNSDARLKLDYAASPSTARRHSSVALAIAGILIPLVLTISGIIAAGVLSAILYAFTSTELTTVAAFSLIVLFIIVGSIVATWRVKNQRLIFSLGLIVGWAVSALAIAFFNSVLQEIDGI